MTPRESIQQLANVLASISPEFTEDDVYKALAEAGVPEDAAGRAYRFAQIACGRRVLDGMGIKFSDEYLCFDRNGDVTKSGSLRYEAHYVAATQLLTPERVGGDVFGRLALMSAEVNAVNNALNAGSKPANLVMTPACLFLEEPTDAGMTNVQKVMSLHLMKLRADNPPPPKPWWKFW